MIKSITEATITYKDVLVRVDLNVPFEKDKISDLSRIIAVVPTLKYIIKKGGRPIIISHLGRPKKNYHKDLSLKKILPHLKKLLNTNIIFCDHLEKNSIKALINKTSKNLPVLLENTRFFEGEESNSPKLGKILAGLGDIYCNDAFSASHRSHASTVAVTEHIPSYSGLLLEREIEMLQSTLLNPQKPVVAVIGGSKVSTKINLLNNLIQKVDHIMIGGGMANTFLFAQKKEIGASLYEKNLVIIAKKILTTASKYNCIIHLPLDIVCATGLNANSEPTVHESDACPKNKMILDCGPKTVTNITKVFGMSKTLLWNGPLGAFEVKPFNNATDAIALAASTLTKEGELLSVAGGGDTVSALNSLGLVDDFSYVSNAGGAFLEWLEGKNLPGLIALSRN